MSAEFGPKLTNFDTVSTDLGQHRPEHDRIRADVDRHGPKLTNIEASSSEFGHPRRRNELLP